MKPACTCGRIIGQKVMNTRNWNPDCASHGTESAWWNTPEQQAKRKRDDERLRDLQQWAREARHKGRP